MNFVEFDYDDTNGRTLTIHGQSEGTKVYFKAYENNKKVTKGSLSTMDLHNIEQFILENAESDEEVLERENDY